MKKAYGFTIVELLIAIVVIAILAAITVVSYNGITQRANNASVRSAARNALNVVRGYVAANDQYPATTNFCLTENPTCMYGGVALPSAATAIAELQKIGSLPSSVPSFSSTSRGIFFSYASTRTFNGEPMPAQLYYFLKGQKQDCGLPDVANSGGYTTVPASEKFTASSAQYDLTACAITIIGPAS